MGRRLLINNSHFFALMVHKVITVNDNSKTHPERIKNNNLKAKLCFDSDHSDMKRSQIEHLSFQSFEFKENSPFSWWLKDGSSRLPPEVERDNIEYKWKLTDISQDRRNHLVTQMRWRVGEFGFCWYILGVKDDGTLDGITEFDLEGTLAVLHDLVSRAKLFVEIVQIVPLAKDEMDNKYICQVKIELDPTRIDRILANTTITSSTSSTSCSNIANEIKVAVLGDFESGKSSLISVLSDWGSLDDSNGKMRTRLLHHRHELLSGTTSSLSIQSVGLKSGGAESIVLTDESLFLKLENRRELLVSEDVKIVHFVDTAGQVKFDHTVLSVLTCLPSPSVVFIVLKGPVDLKEAKISPQTREYFRLAKILKIRVCVIISKIDKSSTELIMLLIDRLVECVGGDYEFELDDGSASDSDSDPDSQNTSINMMACQEQCDTLTQKSSPLTSTSTEFKCKIFPCSAVSGEYLDQINFFLYKSIVKAVEIDGKDCFVLFGRVGHGRIGVNDTFSIGPHHINKATGNYSTPVRIASLQRLKFPIKVAKEGEHVTIAIEPLQALCSEINRGMVLFRCDDQIYANNYLQLKPIKRIIAGIGRININKNTAVESPATRTTYKGSIFINGQRFSHCTLDIEPTSRSLRRLRAAHPHSERICLISFAESNPASVFIQPGAPIIFIENCTKNRDKFAGIIIDYFS